MKPLKHTCHLPGCAAECPPKHLFCGKHWAMVPADLQAEVYATVRRRRKTVDASWAPWWRAQDKATAAVLRKLHPQHEERIAGKLEHDLEFADTLENRTA